MVKKSLSHHVVFIIAYVLLITASFCGCSDSNPKASEEQLAYLQDARENMLEVSSFAIAGDADLDAEFASDAVDMQMQIDFTYEKAGEGSLAEAHVIVEGNSSKNGPIAYTATIYSENEYMYTTMDGTKWYLTDLTQSPSSAMQASGMNLGQFLPGSLIMLIDYAEDIQVITEDEESIEFELRMGKDFYLMQSISEAEQSLGKSYNEFSKDEKMAVEMSVETNTRYGKTSYFYTVDKETCLLVEFGTTLAINFRSPSEKMTMYFEMRLNFSDYGKDFPIQVPEEARDAEYLPPGTSLDL